MPTIFKIGRYIVYFWTNEGEPLESIHVHITTGRAVPDATKLWITSKGKVILCNNNSAIPEKILGRIIRVLEANVEYIINAWCEYFGEIRYFC